MGSDDSRAPKGLASKFFVRRPTQMGASKDAGGVTYYSTSALKGGKHTYSGNVVTRDAKTGEIVSVTKTNIKRK